MSTILVIGATGRIGSALLPQLLDRGHRVLAVTRRMEAAGALSALGAEPVVADIRAPEMLRNQLAASDAVFLATADAPDQDRVEQALVAAIAATGRRLHVVKLSAQSAGLDPPRSFGIYHRRAEQALEASGLPYTILRPTFFQQSLLLFVSDIATKGRLVAPAGKARIAMVNVEDVARAAACILGEAAHAGRTYILTGPSAHSFPDVAERLSALLQRKIRYTSLPGFVARLALPLATGMPRWQSNMVVDLFAALRAGAQTQVSTDVSTLTGRASGSLDTFLAANIDAFRP